MPFFVVNGTPYDVTSFERKEPTRVGSLTRTFTGMGRSSIRAEKIEATAVLHEMSLAAFNALATAIGAGSVPVSGDAFGTTITAHVLLRGAPYVRIRGGGFVVTATLDVSQV